jgi:2-haloacid dehalogenase
MLDFSQFEALTFDCYGTLIDWESGILRALHPMLEAHRIKASEEELLEAYATAESRAESGVFKPYKRVLEEVVGGLGARFGFQPGDQERRSLAESVRTWQPFSDTVGALKRLHLRCKLSVISNIDDDLFAETAKLLEVPFDFVTTALEVGSYKPSLRNFHRSLEKMKVSKDQVLHVAQSLHHDVEPARALGIHSVWVNRRHGKAGGGATVPSSAKPDLEVPDLATLADLFEAAVSGRQSAVS